MGDLFGGSKPKAPPAAPPPPTLEDPAVMEAQARSYRETLSARGRNSTKLAGRRGGTGLGNTGTPGGYQPATTLGGDRR